MPTAANTSITYRLRDEVLVGTNFEGSGLTMTDSWYTRVVKSRKRGTPIKEAIGCSRGGRSIVGGVVLIFRGLFLHYQFGRSC